jgi:hypothetical protein
MENMLRQNSVMGTLHIWRNCGVDPAVMLQSIAQHLAALDGRGPWQQ